MKIRTVFLPSICDDCLKQILTDASEDGVNQVIHHCPHHDSLVHAQLSLLDDEPIISQWIVQGPIPQKEALKVIGQIGNKMDAPLKASVRGSLN